MEEEYRYKHERENRFKWEDRPEDKNQLNKEKDDGINSNR